MATHLNIPDIRATLVDYARRIEALERRLLRQGANRAEQEIIFNLSGTIYVSTSGRAYLRESARAQNAVISLTEGGASITEVGIYRNNILMETVTLAVDQEFQKVPLAATFAADQDHVSVAVITAGAGATDITVQIRFG